jgi:hypothetical protein
MMPSQRPALNGLNGRLHLFTGGLLAALALGSSSSFAQTKPEPIKPGAVRVTTRAPELDKWDQVIVNNGAQRIYKCKALACPDPQTVSFTFSKTLARNPDPKALEKFAKIDLPKTLKAATAAAEVMTEKATQIETLVAKTDMLKGYSAAINESKVTRGKTISFLNTTIIFAGPVMIRVQSTSVNRALAKKSLSQFIEAMQITEGPPPPIPTEPTPNPPAPAEPAPKSVTKTL